MRRTGALAVALVVLLTAASSTAAPLGDRGASTRDAPSARNDATLGERLARALRVPHVDRSESAAVALDLGTGEELFALNESRPLAPASNEKLALTFALLSTLSPSLRIETTAKAIGTVEGATLRGAIALVGGGDPTLTSSDLLKLARRVRASGIRRITGGVLGDESLFDTMRTCLGWKPYFYINESPPLSALVVDRAWYHSYTARRPAKAAALLFRDALRAAGVAVAGNVAVRVTPPEAPLIAKTRSAPLASIIAYMDLHSDNFTAEQLLKLLSLTRAERGSSAAGAQVVMTALEDASIPTKGVRIVDGSGLSAKDRLTTGALVGILQAIAGQPALEGVLLRALPVAGTSGTLKYRMQKPPVRGHVVAKTGTTSIASSLSGYVNSHIAFAIIQNGHPIASWWAREAQDRFARVLASQG
jgi:D-alanyl-D-alanine carboxypeptidase/D-alanyl-D-alanine-endopeptidase (penicillin-binding protein 4)